jgi:hypothetical protein
LRSALLPFVEIVTVGLPFCAFKALTGVILLDVAPLPPLGYLLLALGAVDLALNLGNLVSLLAVQRRVTGVCLADVVLRRLGGAKAPGDLGLAVDVFVSFALVAAVIGFGLLSHLPAWGLVSWNAAVVLNVLGAGAGRLFAALRPGAA